MNAKVNTTTINEPALKMLPMDRQTAKELGMRHYWSSKLCKRGHEGKRYTSTGQCFDCHKLTMRSSIKKYISNNPDAQSKWLTNSHDMRLKLSRERYHMEKQSTPPWVDAEQKEMMEEMKAMARKMTRLTGVKHCVDHQIPLRNKLVCGLNVPTNMRITTLASNSSKGNFFSVDDCNL